MKLYSLFKKKVFDIDLGLDRVENALVELGSPHLSFDSIIVSGTNGKGSTAHYLESLLREHGFKTGLFTSPHLVDENERWQVNGCNISDERLEYYIQAVKPLIEKYNLTYFEACTVLGFLFFRGENVDVAVLEVGLGGRLDATNVVYPEVSVITNVGLDHTHLLGNSLTGIAREKLGIARKDRPLVVGSNQMEIISQAIMMGIKEIYHYPVSFTAYQTETGVEYKFGDITIDRLKIPVPGKRQIINGATAITAFIKYMDRKGKNFVPEKIRKGLESTKIPARMELVQKNPSVIVDGAHNEEAVIQTVKELKKLYPEKDIITVYSGMKDKNWKKIADILKHVSKKLIITTIPVNRSIGKEQARQIKGEMFVEKPEEALRKAIELTDENSLVLVTGSLYLAGEILKSYRKGV
ncbi:bifunctional folylpolyglutamate synthase/dihydrofolate synthase [Persephonella sp.]